MVSLELIRLQLKSYAFSFDEKVIRLVIFMEKNAGYATRYSVRFYPCPFYSLPWSMFDTYSKPIFVK